MRPVRKHLPGVLSPRRYFPGFSPLFVFLNLVLHVNFLFGQTNIALKKPVLASSSISSTYGPANAVDGKTNTSWRSNPETSPWIRVDLGQTYDLTKITLTWSTYYAVAYAIQVSTDGVNWSVVRSLTGQNGSTDDVTGLAARGRYIRIQVTERSNSRYGIWMSELSVAGSLTDITAPSVPVGLAASAVTENSFVLSWTSSTDNVGVSGYDVFRNGVLQVSVTIPSATISGLSSSTMVQMTVRARDAAGNFSAFSAPINVTTASVQSGMVVINFESWPLGTLSSNPYADASGYRMAGRFSSSSGAADPLYIQTVHATRGLMNSNWSSMITLDRADGAAFDLISLDHHGDPWDGLCDATVTGYRTNGTTVSSSFTSGSVFATLNMNWTSLVKVVVDYTGGVNNSYGILDNIRLSASIRDTVVPTVPQSLSASNITAGSFTLNWAASSDNTGVSSYDVFQQGKFIGNVSGTSMLVSALTPQSTYLMTVAAKDGAGNLSAQSAPLSVTTASAPVSGRSNRVGINLFHPGIDWGSDKPFADAMRSHRRWIAPGRSVNDPEPPLDTDYWPLTDAQCLVWAGLDTRNNHGTYRLTFTGQATVTSSAGSLSGLIYDAVSNRTSGLLHLSDAGNADLYLTFTNTRRTQASALNTGIGQVKLMRPVAPGSNVSYADTVMFTNDFIDQLTPFSTLRSLGWVSVNWNQDSIWSDRTLIRHARQSPPTEGKAYGWEGRGASYESLILLANASRKDVWLTIPHKVDRDYMIKLARLFRYGSDGVEPYTTEQAMPVYPPLHPSLKLYVEYSNEIWNDQFSQTSWVYAQARSNAAVKYDGKTDPAQYQYLWGMRFKAVRTVEMSMAFRSVFGSEMMTRVRPVLCFQKGYTDRTNQSLSFMDAYYNRRDSRSTWTDPHPVNYYLYGAGGSFYWYSDQTAVSLSSIWTNGQWDAAKRFTDAWGNPAGYQDQLMADAAWARQFGLAFLNYEGDMHPTYQGGDEAVIRQIHSGVWDGRMLQNTLDHLNVLNRTDVELGCFLNLNGTDGSVWALRNALVPSNSPQYEAVLRFNASTPLPVDHRSVPPFTRPGAAFDTREWETPALNATGAASITANGSYNMSYAFVTPNGGFHDVIVNYSTTGPATFVVELDGQILSSFQVGNTSGQTIATARMNVNCVADRLHAVRIAVVAGSVTVQNLSVLPASPSATPARGPALTLSSTRAIYPNPTAGILHVKMSHDMRRLEVRDLSGRLLRQARVDKAQVMFDVSGLPGGIYILTVTTNDGQVSHHRFLKE